MHQTATFHDQNPKKCLPTAHQFWVLQHSALYYFSTPLTAGDKKYFY